MTEMQHLQQHHQPQTQLFHINPNQQQTTILNSIDCLQLNDQVQLQPIQNIMELVAPQQVQNFTSFCSQAANGAQQTLSSDIKLLQSPQNQQQQQQQQQIQQQQQQQAQVHTIMLNGQPALFIPASSSGLLCQMLMNNNQVYEFIQPTQQIQLQLAGNPNDFSSLLANTNVNNSDTTNGNAISNNIQLAQANQNGAVTFIQLPTLTTNATGNDGNGTSTNGDTHQQQQQQQTILCKIEDNRNDLFTLQTNSNQQHYLQQNDLNTTLNGHHNLTLSENLDVQEQNGKLSGKKPRKPKAMKNPSKKSKKVGADIDDNNHSITNNENININGTHLEIKIEEKNAQDQYQTANQDAIQHWITFETASPVIASANTTTPTTVAEQIDLNGTQKRKRKACDCPNCIKWRQNAMTPEEMAKKRTHKCHKCDKEYNKTSHLRAHLRAHDNYRPYVCDFKLCGKSFTRSDELKRHKRIHNDDRNFPCLICKKKFLRSDHLSKHLLVHNKISANSAASTSSSSSATSIMIKLNAIE